MALAEIRKLTEKYTLVAIAKNNREKPNKLAYILKDESDAVGATIQLEDGFKFVDFYVWNPETGTMEVVTTNDGVVCQTLEWA
jgi:hypothetical protein